MFLCMHVQYKIEEGWTEIYHKIMTQIHSCPSALTSKYVYETSSRTLTHAIRISSRSDHNLKTFIMAVAPAWIRSFKH